MRVLHLTNKPIYPLLDGGCIAMNQMAKLLNHNDFRVKNLTIETTKHPFSLAEFPEQFVKDFQPESVKIDSDVTVFGAVKSILKNESYNLARFNNEKFANRLQELLTQEEFDIILCESIYLLLYLETIHKSSKAKVVVRAHNVEFKIWERLAENARFPKSSYLRLLSKQLKKAEIPLLQKCDAIFCITEEDELSFQSFGVKTKMVTIPVFIEETSQKVDYSSSKFHHLGSMNWQPNLEAVEELVSNLFPKIRAKIPDAELHLAGSFFPPEIVSNPEMGIFVHGFVADKFEFLNSHGIQLIPLKSGSGVRIKILESMGIGVPIVTTTIGAAGIDVQDSKEIFIAKNDFDFVEKAVQLNKNAELRQQIGLNAQNFILKNYSFAHVNKHFIEFIKTIS